jgi:arylsulfatase A-like enzyme
MDLESSTSSVAAPSVASLLLALCLALACTAGEEAPIAAAPRPGLNVIVLSFDALRADALGSYGSTRGASPQIDAWAKRSIVFENSYAVSPVTPTSFASLFSGQPPLEVFRDWRFAAAGGLAPSFAAAGYATGAFLHNPQLDSERGFGAGFEKYVVFGSVDGRLDARVVTRALDWMTRQSRPFFAWIHLLDPHAAWDRYDLAEELYDPGYRGRYAESGPGKALVERDPVELERLESLYAGEVFVADHHFGRLLSALETAGLLEQSALLLTADHGEGLMDHGLLQHGELYEEDLRIPLILGLPDLGAGRRVRTPVTQLDIFPTLASLAGVPVAHPVAGRDLTQVLEGERGVVGVAYTDRRRSQASLLVEGGLKVIVACGRHATGGPPSRRLFDLRSDPEERQDLAANRSAEAEALERRLWAKLGLTGCEDLTMNLGAGRHPHEGLDPEAVRRLEALGYTIGTP